MNRRSQYARDTQIEAMTASFLDTYFWSKLSPRAVAKRWKDTQHQFEGIDVSLSCDRGIFNFDEKCKTYGCLNQQLNFLSFELSFINKAGEVQDGWFATKNKTDYLMFIQLSATVDDTKLLRSEDDILAADLLCVSKKDVIDMVEEHSTMEQIKEDAQELRDDEFDNVDIAMNGKSRKKYPHRKFWLTFSAQLFEKPVNLVTSRDTLLKLPHTKHMVITKKGFKLI